MNVVVEAFVVPPFAENAYLVADLGAGEAVVVDPGGRSEEIVRRAAALGARITAIVNTHAHVDHVLGVAALRAATGAPFRLHPEAALDLVALPAQAALFGLGAAEAPAVDGALAAGEVVRVGGLGLAVRLTPGHARGHVTLVSDAPVAWAGAAARVALCGDVIFAGSVGRVDLPGGDEAVLAASIGREILTLPDETVLLPGHGPATTVGAERAANPFLAHWRRAGALA